MVIATRRRTAGPKNGESIIIEAAWMYYHDGLNQTQIAEALGISRATVVNYLQEARARNYIRISLDPEVFTDHHLAQDLQEKFGLQGAFVLPSGNATPQEALLRVARGAADWLPSLLSSGDRLGVAWGRTVYEVAEALEQNKMSDITITQLLGSMATPFGFTAEICSAHMAHKLGADCINLHAPAIMSDAKLAARLREEPIIHAQLDALSHCNKAIFAAGSCTDESHIVSSGLANKSDLDWYVKRGAKGVLCGRFIDENGQTILGELDDRIIGVTLDKLQGLDMGLLVSEGAEKVAPMLAAIAGGYVTHIVTSNDTARQLLASKD